MHGQPGTDSHLIALFASAVALLAAMPVGMEPLQIVEGPGYIGAIFPSSRGSEASIPLWPGETIQGYWTPTPEEIASVEAALAPAMKAAAKDPLLVLSPKRDDEQRRAWKQGEIAKIVEKFDQYGHQYVGIKMSGSKRVFVNCFRLTRSGSREQPAYWRTRFVVVDDGGFWYWQIQYDVERKRFLAFESNGYA